MKRYNKTDHKGNKYALIKRKKTNGSIYYGKSYPKGKKQDDVIPISLLASTSLERACYPTQKPLKLISIFIKSSSNEGDVVLDFFGGSGTTALASAMMNRKFITGDLNPVVPSYDEQT